MNISKVRNPGNWKTWANKGGVDFTPRARQLGVAIFSTDPIIGCPFDPSEMEMVEIGGNGQRVGEWLYFRDTKRGSTEERTKRGRILAIGRNAKFLSRALNSKGLRFTAYAVQMGARVVIKRRIEGWPQWREDLLMRIETHRWDAAANTLVCSTIDHNGDWEQKDFDCYHAMFQHPTVLAHAKELWALMIPLLCPKFVDQIRKEMIAEGWQLD
ncbi:MAG: hypothetical protein JWN37_453 [Candidatus Nomurabacteria bacterium]|nr:hypothetical protein [Candidatus Nomurabacteria bacterium]